MDEQEFVHLLTELALYRSGEDKGVEHCPCVICLLLMKMLLHHSSGPPIPSQRVIDPSWKPLFPWSWRDKITKLQNTTFLHAAAAPC